VLLEQALGLVVHVRGDRLELRGVLASVVCAEEQLAHGQHHANVGLRATTVAAVGCGQRFGN